MAPEKHALLSASSASRWLVCTAAPRFEEGLPERTSEYAEEGRLAHAIAELKVLKKSTVMTNRTYNSRLNKLKKDPSYNPEMDKTTDLYLEYSVLPDAGRIAAEIMDLLLAVRPSNMWLLMVSFVQSEGCVQMGALTERSVYMDVWPMLVNELESAGGIKMAGPLEYHATVEIYPYKEDIENA